MNDCSVLGARSRNLAGAAVFLLTTVAFAEQQVEVFHGGMFEAVPGISNAVPAQALKPQPGNVIDNTVRHNLTRSNRFRSSTGPITCS